MAQTRPKARTKPQPQIDETEALDRLAAHIDQGPHALMHAIDPGEVHCGVALFAGDDCVDCWEMAPHALFKYLKAAMGMRWFGTLVVEQFRLYPWMAEQQSFSELLTVQYIGVIKYIWAEHGCLTDPDAPRTMQILRDGKEHREVLAVEWVTYVENPATIKTPCRAILKAKKVPQVSKRLKAGGHAADAELHGHYYLMHQKGQVPTFAVGRDNNPAEVIIIEAPGKEPKRPSGSVTKPSDRKAAHAAAEKTGGEIAKRARKTKAAKKVNPVGAKAAADMLRPKRT